MLELQKAKKLKNNLYCGGAGDTWVGGGIVCGICGVVSTGGGFQRMYADLTT